MPVPLRWGARGSGSGSALLDSDTRWAAGRQQGWGGRDGRARGTGASHLPAPRGWRGLCPGPSGAFDAAADEEGRVCEKRGQRQELASVLHKTSGIFNRPGPLS